jgi:hypothetical protein
MPFLYPSPHWPCIRPVAGERRGRPVSGAFSLGGSLERLGKTQREFCQVVGGGATLRRTRGLAARYHTCTRATLTGRLRCSSHRRVLSVTDLDKIVLFGFSTAGRMSPFSPSGSKGAKGRCRLAHQPQSAAMYEGESGSSRSSFWTAMDRLRMLMFGFVGICRHWFRRLTCLRHSAAGRRKGSKWPLKNAGSGSATWPRISGWPRTRFIGGSKNGGFLVTGWDGFFASSYPK